MEGVSDNKVSGKYTGMLLDMDQAELLTLLEVGYNFWYFLYAPQLNILVLLTFFRTKRDLNSRSKKLSPFFTSTKNHKPTSRASHPYGAIPKDLNNLLKN